MVEADAQLQVKKRARRRLVGAVAFASMAAIILPVVMDQEPRQPVQEVEIRIPGQDEKPFNPKLKPVPAPLPAPAAAIETPPAPLAPSPQPAPLATAPVVPAVVTPPAPEPKAPEKKPEKQDKAEKPQVKPEKPEKPEKLEKSAKPHDDDAKRAASILSGKTQEQQAGNGQFAILIGAFSNSANVKNIQQKLTEQGIKTWTENLDSPSGTKTRVRAGPFASRDAAEKALDKMKRIGITGVVANKP